MSIVYILLLYHLLMVVLELCSHHYLWLVLHLLLCHDSSMLQSVVKSVMR